MSDSNPGLSFGTGRQMQIYTAGQTGQKPQQPVSIEELEQRAKAILPREAFDYVAGGAGAERTLRDNLNAFDRWQFVPKFLHDVGQRDLHVDLLGQRFSSPVMLAPLGVLSIVHEQAEIAVARAARSVSTPFVLSTVSSFTIEQVAAELGDVPRWFQLYWPKDDALAASFLHRAERAGYSAIVVTLDTYLLGWRERDIQNAYLPFFSGAGLANYFTDPVFQRALGCDPKANPQRAIQHFASLFSDPSRTWEHLTRLQKVTRLPIILKGVLHPDDARRAMDYGATGIIVSNHGGRQLDGEISALDALPDIVRAVGDQMTILFDSGLRRGSDILKAMALGAEAVLLGRPYAYGLAVNGETGVRDVLLNLLADLDLSLGLCGCASLADLRQQDIIRKITP